MTISNNTDHINWTAYMEYVAMNLFSKWLNLYDHRSSTSHTDRQTDGRLAIRPLYA